MVLMPGYYVRMVSTRGQSACRTNGPKVLHQRLNVEHPFSSSWFCQWLEGVTDGDGTFSISRQENSWNLIFKISQNSYNLWLLFYIKRMLGVGHVSIEKSSDMASFRIRDRKQLAKVIFPILDQFPLLPGLPKEDARSSLQLQRCCSRLRHTKVCSRRAILQKRGHWNPRIGLKQSIMNFPYIWYVYNELAYLCSGQLMFGSSTLRGQIVL